VIVFKPGRRVGDGLKQSVYVGPVDEAWIGAGHQPKVGNGEWIQVSESVSK